MPAAIHNFIIEQGSTFTILFEYTDSIGNLQDISNYCIRLRLKSSDGSDIRLYSSNESGSDSSLTNISTGIVRWFLSSNITSTFKFAAASYDLDITSNETGYITRLATGTIQVIANSFPECPDNSKTYCKTCSDIKASDGTGNSGGVTPSGSVTATPTPTVTITGGGNEETVESLDLCDYLCQDIDIFAKLYDYQSYIKHVSGVTSGNLIATSGQTEFNLNQPYVVGLLDIYLNNNQLVYPTDYIASNNTSFILSSGANDGDLLTYINKGLYLSDMTSITGAITVPDTGSITNVEVSIVGLKHQSPQDLSMLLVPPTGNSILLSAYSKINNYSASSGLTYTYSNKAIPGTYLYNRSTFDNYVNIYNKTGIYPNTTVASLTQLTGIVPSGDWKLIVNDSDPGSSGTLNGWNLIITYSPPVYSE